MADSLKKLLITGAFITLIAGYSAECSEMVASLREADRLYQIGRYEQAIEVAGKFIEFSPENLEAMLILGMSHFNSGDYPEARQWFRKALKKQRKNILASQYLELIREIEHRYGPFSENIDLARTSKDPQVSGQAFKKGWFGHGFPKESEPTRQYFDPGKNIPAPIALEVKAPLEKVLIEQSVAEMAKEAFSNKLFVKSYLFYSQLLDASPENRTYLLGKAESAFMLERFDEVIKTLGPIMLFGKEKSFSPQELKLANKLIDQSRLKINSLK